MEYFIISGASRGIGKALAESLAGSGRTIISCSRSDAPELQENIRQKGGLHHHLSLDLSDQNSLIESAGLLFSYVDTEQASRILLMNNAAMLEPVAPSGRADKAMTIDHISLNLIVPMVLTSAFIERFRDLSIPKTILNISSGAGKNPYYGWSAYCSSKAGLDMFCRCVALEQEEEPNPVRILSIGPGVVDTAMQDTIRSKNREDFRELQKFVSLKENGRLQSPASVAGKLIAVIEDPGVQSGTVADLRELY